MDYQEKKYELELWSIQGERIADISHLATNRRFTLERNEAETLTFDLDLDEFQRYCSENLNTNPRNILFPYRTDVKVKRYGEYLFGTQVAAVNGALDIGSKTLSVQCSGYLNLLKDRYVTVSYVNTDGTIIARNIITETQSQTNGSLGITLEASPYLTGILRERNYERDNAKTAIQNLTSLISGNFDFSFTWDKEFRVYEKIGSPRGDLDLVYPGENVVKVDVERSGLNIFNKVIGVGSGFGQEQLTSVQSDTVSQLTYLLREKVAQFNSVSIQATLDQNTAARLEIFREILEIPKVSVNGNLFPKTVPFIGVGDRVPFSIIDHPYYDNIDGLYRVEKIDVTLDENDFESNIDLYFDNLGVDQDEPLE